MTDLWVNGIGFKRKKILTFKLRVWK